MSPDATDRKVDTSIDRALERFHNYYDPEGGSAGAMAKRQRKRAARLQQWAGQEEGQQRAREQMQRRDRMRRLGMVVMILAGTVLVACPAAAQDDGADLADVDPCADLEHEATVPGLSDPVPLIQDGARGIWFPSPLARHLLCVVRTRSLDGRELRLWQQEVELWRKRADMLREQLDLAVEARDILAETIEVAERRAREAEESEASIWPRILWATAGGAVVAAVVGVLRLVTAL